MLFTFKLLFVFPVFATLVAALPTASSDFAAVPDAGLDCPNKDVADIEGYNNPDSCF
ncbi:hypothetical protein C8Q78DRAFT_1082144 [Trametes maxima]|nr:hypothetical protein C8Q78DRAFT_1082144 [Trametes maxima]